MNVRSTTESTKMYYATLKITNYASKVARLQLDQEVRSEITVHRCILYTIGVILVHNTKPCLK